MLAQNFMSAADLKILEIERDGLIRALVALEMDEINERSFNMSVPMAHRSCGTVACIGGWAAIFAGIEPNDFLNKYGNWHASGQTELSKLFWPGDVCPAAYGATPTQAADALRRYLVTGRCEWTEVMAASAEGAAK